MKALFVLLISTFLLACSPVIGERMVRIVESSAQTGYLVSEVNAGGIRIETSDEPLPGEVYIEYRGAKSAVIYKSGHNNE